MQGGELSSDSDQRRESRLPAAGFQVEISRHKWGLGNAKMCRLVDLSSNGLSFVTHDNHLGPLDKIAFRLHIGEGIAEGKAVICYRQPENDSRWRYGAMFLTISPEVEKLLEEEPLSSYEVRNVARQLADTMVMERSRVGAQKRLLRSRVLLYDAIQAFIDRLKAMDYPVGKPIRVSLEEGFTMGKENPLVIAALEHGLGYASNRGDHFSNVFEVLEFLRAELTVSRIDR